MASTNTEVGGIGSLRANGLGIRRRPVTRATLALVACGGIALAAADAADARTPSYPSLAPAPAHESAGLDTTLTTNGQIIGTVTSAEGGEPLEGIEVCALVHAVPAKWECAYTSATGEYAIGELPAGEYKVRFAVPESDEANYATQYYNGKAYPLGAQAVSVAEGATTREINAALVKGGTIAGTVTSAPTGEPLEDAKVCATSVILESVRCAPTGAHGEYEITALSTANYTIYFWPPNALYEGQYYKQPLAIEAGANSDGQQAIDAALKLNRPENEKPPGISGSAVVGQKLKVVHGVWSNEPSSYREVWRRCDGTGEINSCTTTVGTDETYTPTAADVGHAIRVWEMAVNSTGESVCVLSPATSDVVEPATQQQSPQQSSSSTSTGSSSSSPPPPPPPPAREVLSTKTAVASAAALKELLLRLLTPTGKGAKIRSLLEHRGYALSFNALAPGLLKIAWYIVPKGAHIASVEAQLAAVGVIDFASAGVVKLEIKLTSKGKALLAHAHRVKLTAQGSFAPSGQAVIRASREFTLER